MDREPGSYAEISTEAAEDHWMRQVHGTFCWTTATTKVGQGPAAMSVWESIWLLAIGYC